MNDEKMSNVRITKEDVDSIIKNSIVESVKMGKKTTVVSLTMPCGFVIVVSSSCVDPDNYDHELGVKICLKRVEDKVWELEGYRLQFNVGLNKALNPIKD